jgi:hypothetical protein
MNRLASELLVRNKKGQPACEVDPDKSPVGRRYYFNPRERLQERVRKNHEKAGGARNSLAAGR